MNLPKEVGRMPNEYPQRLIKVGDTRLHIVEAGPENGVPLIMLHGFPEFWWSWRQQIPELARKGFRIVAVDMRGYGKSDAVPNVERYGLDSLAPDVVGLADALGWRQFNLIGHDWGGIVAWAVAAHYPERIARMAILNAPHPDVMSKVIRKHPSQIIRSAYIGLFQLPLVPEALLSFRNFKLLRRSLVSTSRPGTFSREDLDRYAVEWSRAGRLHAMLNYYRALVRRKHKPLGSVRPTALILWGRKDHALDFSLAEASLATCMNGRLIVHETATHWVHHEEPQWVNENLVSFFA
jgi:pimeloyl-ACP methyl ester carboxylesterase